ncbi:MAG: hypothetical protein OHK0056_03920 [Bacteriovoracaceae bacterium]
MNQQRSKKFLIVQLARTGDLLQTLAAARAFKQNHPEIELSLLARYKYSSPIEEILSTTFIRVFNLDKRKVLKGNNVEEIIANVDDFINVLNAQQFDVVLNFSICKTSSYICTLLKTQNKLGSYFSNRHEFIQHDILTQYVSSFVLNSSVNAINLAEIWASMLGDYKFSNPTPNRIMQTNKILIHPFASQKRKFWKSGKWVEIIYSILKANDKVSIDICGSKEEEEDALAMSNDPLLSKFKNRIIVLAGKISVADLYKKMDDYKVFIGHDSMVSHLASLKGVDSITIPLGSVRPHETFPLTTGSLVLSPKVSCFPCYATQKCEDFSCHTDISHQLVAELTIRKLNSDPIDIESIAQKIGQYHISSSNIYIVQLSSDGHFQLYPIAERLNTKAVMRDIYHILWSFKLFEASPSINLPRLGQQQINDIQRVKANIQYLFELAEFGKKYCSYILQELNSSSPRIDNINAYSSKIDEIDKLSKSISEGCIELSPLINFYEHQKANSKGTSIVEITESTYLIYNDLSISCSVINELIDKINVSSGKTRQTHQGR